MESGFKLPCAEMIALFGGIYRIGYQLGLDRPRRRPLPDDELAARLELVGIARATSSAHR